MKLFLLIISAFCLSITGTAQGNSNGKGKAKGNGKAKTYQVKSKKVGIHSSNGTAGKFSKHQPKKVEAALLRDYPRASNVTWRKHKGDYYATFNNGAWRSTAVYHANGDRRDTRTPINRDQLPGNIWTDIFNRDNVTPTYYERIERPSTAESIFRVLTGTRTSYFYDANGNRVSYVY